MAALRVLTAGALCCCLVSQSCLTLCDPVDLSPPGSSVLWDFPGRNTGVLLGVCKMSQPQGGLVCG